MLWPVLMHSNCSLLMKIMVASLAILVVAAASTRVCRISIRITAYQHQGE
jgi:VIT1/CCC1 family predicted Fe2+/Mn2+ transporter